MAESNQKSLAARIAAISSEIGAIDKSGRNQQQGYAYIEYGKVAAQIRSLQAKHGVAIVPRIENCTSNEVRNSKGGLGYHYLLNMVFRVVNTDNNDDFFESTWIGEATDFGDKGINKAVTSAVKYCIMRLYNISEQGEQDADATTPEQLPPKQPKPERKVDYKTLSMIRGKLPTINTVEQLAAYQKSLKLDPTHWSLLKKDFTKRKEEINGME